ncbi:hypothetical protein EIP91_002669 [Steccherinum ochraceum]|uniref:AB hydrolase-1 domain-containing protein n=1 Tax=Steccherinum ochraceum TaxID=92696 RepID=A0A4R0RI52_9APHY|nr:hypothetical protein EIP91_002669 [Steccherinum ochraceum]
MFTGSYPKPDAPWPYTYNPRILEPILPYPTATSHTSPPSLPTTRQARSLLHPEWTLSTHVVPAAYPRTTPLVPVPPIPAFAFGKDKKQRREEIVALANELAEAKLKQGKGELKSLGRDQTALWCCVNRYVRKRSGSGIPKGITLFFAHANGFMKEIWEPTLLHLVNIMREKGASYEVAEIWCFDGANHGDSAIVNEGKLSGIYDWQDNARDLSNFLTNYLPHAPTSSDLPTHLSRVSPSESKRREEHGFAERTLVGVGHSYGGCSIVWSASHKLYSHLFDSIILVDPIIAGAIPYSAEHFAAYLNGMSVGALSRRDTWSSREEALRLFQASAFFQKWDPEVLKVYVEYGLRENPDGSVSLKTKSIQEAITFAEQLSSIEAWYHLPNIDERIALKFIMPAGNGEPGDKAEEKQHLVWRRPVNCSNVLNPNAGHLIPHETPHQLAEDIHAFLQSKYPLLKNRL